MLRRSLLVGLQMAPQKMTSAITSLHMARYYMLYLLHLRVFRMQASQFYGLPFGQDVDR